MVILCPHQGQSPDPPDSDHLLKVGSNPHGGALQRWHTLQHRRRCIVCSFLVSRNWVKPLLATVYLVSLPVIYIDCRQGPSNLIYEVGANRFQDKPRCRSSVGG